MLLLLLILIPFMGAFISMNLGLLRERLRDQFNILLTLVMICLVIWLYPEVEKGDLSYFMGNVMGTGLYLKLDLFRYYLVLLTAVVWFLVTLYSGFYLNKHKNRNRYYFAYLLTYAFTLGIFMSENLLNLFTFFEAMTFSSYMLVIHDEDEFSHRAGISYLAMAISGGLVMLMGILVAYDYTGTLLIGEMAEKIKTLEMATQNIIGGLILVGFAVKSSLFPLHTWLSKAYVASPTPATAILSGVLLKTGLFGMLITTTVLVKDATGVSYMLICLGLVNVLHGGFLALQQRNIKRAIAYSSMSQAGFIIIGIGLMGILGHEGGVAYLATVLYMLSHAFTKVLLFLVVGIVLVMYKEITLTEIWGFCRRYPLLKGLFLIGLLGTIGFPGFSGFTAKTLLHDAILEGQHLSNGQFFIAVEGLYYVGSALTVAYLLKVFIALFISKNPEADDRQSFPMNYQALLPIVLASLLVISIGVMPDLFMKPLLESQYMATLATVDLHDLYNAASLKSIALSIGLGVFIYVAYVQRKLIQYIGAKRVYLNHTANWFDIEDDLYKPLVQNGFKSLTKVMDFSDTWMTKILITLRYAFVYISNLDVSLLRQFEWDRRLIDQATDLSSHEIGEDLTVKTTNKSLKEAVQGFYQNINSINYAILFVVGVIVGIMMYLFLSR